MLEGAPGFFSKVKVGSHHMILVVESDMKSNSIQIQVKVKPGHGGLMCEI